MAVNTLSMAAGPIGAALLAPILARTLGAEGRGEMAAILAPLTFADAFATVGIPAAIAYFRARGTGSARLVRLALPALVTAGLLAYLVLFLFAPTVAGRHGLDLGVVRILWAAVLAGIVLAVLRACRQGEANWTRLNLEAVLGPVLRVAACGALFLTGSESVQLVTAVYLGSGIVVGLVLVRPRAAAAHPLKPHAEPTRGELTSFGLRSWATTLSSVVNARIDQLVLAVALPAYQLGLYAVSVTVAELPSVLYRAAAPVLFTRVAGGYGWDGSARVVRLVAWSSAILATGLAVVAAPLVELVFGAEFAGAVVLVQILLAGAVLAASATAIGAVLAASGSPGLVSLTEAGGVVATLLGMLLAVPRWGAVGAAVTVSLTQLLLWGSRATIFVRASGLGLSSLLVLRRADLAAVLAGGRAR
ncbi:oligosaccharide flippase family protein [Pseudonocardia sp.]|uniref:oligosaccharide flippase family protein n=1 Tax=Pseudonocardia sp. TaxID=60912 RepID=UPI003D124C1D